MVKALMIGLIVLNVYLWTTLIRIEIVKKVGPDSPVVECNFRECV